MNTPDSIKALRRANPRTKAGYAHAVACCLGREAERTGRKMRYDPTTRRIVEATGRTGDSLG